MLNIDDLLGVKFTSHGRSIKEGFDCYGLAIEVSRRLGHILDDVWYKKACPKTFNDKAEITLRQLSDRLTETKSRTQGDLIVFFDSNKNMVHIGVMMDEDYFIHADLGGVRVTELYNYYRKDWKVYTWLQ